MSSPHGHPQYHSHPHRQSYIGQPYHSPSPPTHTSISPHLSTSPNPPPHPSYHNRTPSHSHPPIPVPIPSHTHPYSHSASPHHPSPQLGSHTPTTAYLDRDTAPQEGYDQNHVPGGGGGGIGMQRQQSQQRHPSFLPIFTLIEDSTSQEHFHPKVHYIFSDDVDTPLDVALGRTARDPPQNQGHNTLTKRGGKAPRKRTGDQDDLDSVGWPRQIRPIIVSMSPDLTHVEGAWSLAPDWQLTNVTVGKAPQWLVGDETFPGTAPGGMGSVISMAGGGHPGGGGGGGGGASMGALQEQQQEGLMLTIEGTSIPDPGLKKNSTGEGLYELANSFADRMAMIKRVIEYGQQQELEEQERQRQQEREAREQYELEQRVDEMQIHQHQDGQGGGGAYGLGFEYSRLNPGQRQDEGGFADGAARVGVGV